MVTVNDKTLHKPGTAPKGQRRRLIGPEPPFPGSGPRSSPAAGGGPRTGGRSAPRVRRSAARFCEGPTGLGQVGAAGGGDGPGRGSAKPPQAPLGPVLVFVLTELAAEGSAPLLLPLSPCRPKCRCPGSGPALHITRAAQRARGEAELRRDARSLRSWLLGSAQSGAWRLLRGRARCRGKHQHSGDDGHPLPRPAAPHGRPGRSRQRQRPGCCRRDRPCLGQPPDSARRAASHGGRALPAISLRVYFQCSLCKIQKTIVKTSYIPGHCHQGAERGEGEQSLGRAQGAHPEGEQGPAGHRELGEKESRASVGPRELIPKESRARPGTGSSGRRRAEPRPGTGSSGRRRAGPGRPQGARQTDRPLAWQREWPHGPAGPLLFRTRSSLLNGLNRPLVKHSGTWVETSYSRNWNSPRGRTSLPGPGLPPPLPSPGTVRYRFTQSLRVPAVPGNVPAVLQPLPQAERRHSPERSPGSAAGPVRVSGEVLPPSLRPVPTSGGGGFPFGPNIPRSKVAVLAVPNKEQVAKALSPPEQSCDPRCAGNGLESRPRPVCAGIPASAFGLALEQWQPLGPAARPSRRDPASRTPVCPPGAEPLRRINARSALSAWGAGPGGTAGLRDGPAGSSEPLCPGRARRAAERRPVPASRTAFCDRAAGSASRRAGEQALQKGKASGSRARASVRPLAAERSARPRYRVHPRQRWQCAARKANTASPLLPRHRRPGPGRRLSGTRCEPGPHRAGAAPPAPSSADPRARQGPLPAGPGRVRSEAQAAAAATGPAGKESRLRLPLRARWGLGPRHSVAGTGLGRNGTVLFLPGPRLRASEEEMKAKHGPAQPRHNPEASAAPGRAHGRGAAAARGPERRHSGPARPAHRGTNATLPAPCRPPPRQPRGLAEMMERPARVPQPIPVCRSGERCPPPGAAPAHSARPAPAAASRSRARRSE
ncbi:collagen alpha-1(I) chain-like [Haemorhous mexicanus]|uniref:collagen alpha-1(I) chain-like n=1 Tax=Haemorhous mexicanus TaxID=30427 RepID=UPI0028BEBE1D|nr:collagen alpha-1(I) chain-like [Haemorhous mexicanus]